jgi:DNA-directed RNA polymerase subunit alpha
MFSDEPQKAFLKVKGEKEVKGSDFQLPSQLELVNPDERVALMTDKKTELEIEIEVEKGVGYLSREARKRTQKLAIGEILLDAIFSPVKKVGYQIENMRVGERTDFDKVVLSVETDGTLSPERALVDAAKILVDQFSVVANSFSEEELVQTPRPFKKPKREKKPAAKKAVKKTKKKR